MATEMTPEQMATEMTPEQIRLQHTRQYMREYFKRCSPETFQKLKNAQEKYNSKIVACDCGCGRNLPIKLRGNHRYVKKKKTQSKFLLVS